MTNQDRQHVEKLAYQFKLTHNWNQGQQDAFVEGWSACNEPWRIGYENLMRENDRIKDALRAEIVDLQAGKDSWEKWMRNCNESLNAERARSAKLVEAIKPQEWDESPEALDIKFALLKYEASRD